MGRRIIKQNYTNLAIFVFSILGINYFYILTEIARINTSYISGWILFSSIMLLSLYGLRRFFLPFSKVSITNWRVFHIVLGQFSVLAFLFHTKFSFVTGYFQIGLAFLFILISLTGLVGVYIQRTIPKKLSQNGIEFLYEQIPSHRQNLHNEFGILVAKSAESGTLPLISSEILENLHSHFAANKNLLSYFFYQSKPAILLKRELTSLISLNTDCKLIATELLKLVEQKNRLDHSYANQFILKHWKMLHAPFIGALVLLITLHIFLVYSFRM